MKLAGGKMQRTRMPAVGAGELHVRSAAPGLRSVGVGLHRQHQCLLGARTCASGSKASEQFSRGSSATGSASDVFLSDHEHGRAPPSAVHSAAQHQQQQLSEAPEQQQLAGNASLSTDVSSDQALARANGSDLQSAAADAPTIIAAPDGDGAASAANGAPTQAPLVVVRQGSPTGTDAPAVQEEEGSNPEQRRASLLSPSPEPSASALSSMEEGAKGTPAAAKLVRQFHAAVPELDDTPQHPAKVVKGSQLNLAAAAACSTAGLLVRFAIPIPTGITPESWTLLAVFVSTIAGLILEPLPVSAWSLCCVTTLLATKACTFTTAMSGLTNDAIWLIVIAFFVAKALEKTGLGERIANVFVSAVGQSTLGVAYSLAVAEVLMAPAMPSCTARAGGIFMPVIKFLAQSRGSEPRLGRRKMGAFLVHTQMQVSSNVAALFMTAAAQNLLAMNIARSMGIVVPNVWTTWMLGALVPSLISVATIPLLMYHLTPPDIKQTPDAPAEARQRLAAMGPLSIAERVTLATLGGAVLLWMLGDSIGCPAVLGAMIALSTLLLTGVLTWRDCLEYTPAWDTLLWFSVLMSMCSAMASGGLVDRMAEAVGSALAAAKLPWLTSFGLLHAIFFWSHYVFASQVGHVGALYGAFLGIMLAAGAPSTLSALTLGYSSNLFGSLTHYASGPAAIFHGSGYTRLSEVMKAGFLMALRSWLVWGVVGMAWWKVLGWW